MQTFIFPETSTASKDLPEGYKSVAIPDTLKVKDKLDLFSEQVQAVVNKQIDLEARINSLKETANKALADFDNHSNKNIEIIGVFSSVIALLILNVEIVASSSTFLKAIILIISLTCSISIFAILINTFFSNKNNTVNKYFWIPFSILLLFLILAILAEILDWCFLKYS